MKKPNIPSELIIAVILSIILSLLLPGCVVCYAPEARTFALYSHVQQASNMVVNQDIPVEFLKAQDFGKAAATANVLSGNTAKVK